MLPAPDFVTWLRDSRYILQQLLPRRDSLKRRIMVVDDDPGIQEAAAAILEDEGYQVIHAGDGVQALELLSPNCPDLILLDLMLPRMTGSEFMEELAQRGLRSAVSVVIFTADSRAKEKAATVGADGFIEKPFHLAALLDEIERVLQRTRPAAPSQEQQAADLDQVTR